VVADAAQDLDERRDEADVEHRLGQLDVPEVAGAVLHIGAVGRALERAVHGAQAQVGQAAGLGAALLIRGRRVDLGHRVLALRARAGRAQRPWLVSACGSAARSAAPARCARGARPAAAGAARAGAAREPGAEGPRERAPARPLYIYAQSASGSKHPLLPCAPQSIHAHGSKHRAPSPCAAHTERHPLAAASVQATPSPKTPPQVLRAVLRAAPCHCMAGARWQPSAAVQYILQGAHPSHGPLLCCAALHFTATSSNCSTFNAHTTADHGWQDCNPMGCARARAHEEVGVQHAKLDCLDTAYRCAAVAEAVHDDRAGAVPCLRAVRTVADLVCIVRAAAGSRFPRCSRGARPGLGARCAFQAGSCESDTHGAGWCEPKGVRSS